MKIIWTLILAGSLLMGVLYVARADDIANMVSNMDTANIGAWVSTQPKEQMQPLPEDYTQVIENEEEYIKKIQAITAFQTPPSYDPTKTQKLSDIEKELERR